MRVDLYNFSPSVMEITFVVVIALVTKSCPTLGDPIDCSTPGSSLFMGFPRKEFWSGLPFPPPRGLPHPEMEPASPALAGRFFTAEPPGKPGNYIAAFQKPSGHLCKRGDFPL